MRMLGGLLPVAVLLCQVVDDLVLVRDRLGRWLTGHLAEVDDPSLVRAVRHTGQYPRSLPRPDGDVRLGAVGDRA